MRYDDIKKKTNKKLNVTIDKSINTNGKRNI